MKVPKRRLIKKLSEMARLSFEITLAYSYAIESTKDSHLKIVFAKFKNEYSSQLSALKNSISNLGGNPLDFSQFDLKSWKQRNVIPYQVPAQTALSAMLSNEILMHATYEQASELNVPEDVRGLITRNYGAAKRHLVSIGETLKHSYGVMPVYA